MTETIERPPFDALPIAPVRLADGVVAALSGAILDGRLRPGEALPAEARLAERFGVSKPVIREAIRQLEALGAVQIGQGRPTRVAQALDAQPLARFWRFAAGGTRAGLAEAVELRRMIEPQVARLAAQRATAEGLGELQAILGRMEAAFGDVPRWITADLDFHDQLGVLSGNRLVRLQVHGLRPVIEEIMRLFNARGPRGPADWRATWERHHRVAEAIAAGDPDAAEAAMLAHFAAAEAAIAELFPKAARPS
ncbi:FadR family transcriptional regulator [Roseomonas sp. OT10]|uniref:FadR/GntR family transcriptional regulator n=1 Tax=Roseomonas cutis TaxID=2897332 RepID=UPI001E355603|nr:FadR/GntR family transcriptional regulator [Roseomonas sp. OT10]UFN50967.1 FadR family transcriptional regulator [Roseomonas sp. OT10]